MEDNVTFATEIIRELKASNERNQELTDRFFVIVMLQLAVILIIVCGIFWYISLPTEESVCTVEQEADNNGFNQIIGGDYFNGSEAESDLYEETSSNPHPRT